MSVPKNIRFEIESESAYADIISDPLDPDLINFKAYKQDDIEYFMNKTLLDPSNTVAANYLMSGQNYLTIEDTGSELPADGTVLAVKGPGLLGFVVSQGSGGSGGVSSVNGKTGIVTINKGDVGLGNVDNTSDMNKPVSVYQQSALDGKVSISSYGQPNGCASLDSTGKLPVAQLPNSVLSGVQFGGTWDASTGLPNFGPATNANRGTIYVVSVAGSQLLNGQIETFSVGDQIISNSVLWEIIRAGSGVSSVNGMTGGVTITKDTVGLNLVDNTSDINKPVSNATQNELDLKMNKSDIVNTLSYGDPEKPLSSAMGFQLNTLKLSVVDVVDSLTSTSQVKPLSANMGNQLNASISTKVASADLASIVNPMIHAIVDPVESAMIPLTQKGQADGVPELDSTGRMPISQIPASIIGAMTWRGTWNAQDNIPLIPAADPVNNGYMYQCTVTGTQSINGYPQAFSVGEWIISNGSIWEIVPSSVLVSSVQGRLGNVIITKTDVGLGSVDNTSDANKPISTATQNALNLKISTSKINNTLTGADSTEVLGATQGTLLDQKKINFTDIVDNLTSGGSNVPLSAQQGLVLESSKISKTSITEELNSTDSTQVLAATVGPTLVSSIDLKVPKNKINNSLVSIDSSEVLGAPQGRILNENKIDKTNIYTGLDGDNPNKVLSSVTGPMITDLISGKVPKTDVVNNLIETDPTKVLSAAVGPSLVPKADIVTVLTETDSTKVLSASAGPVLTGLIDGKVSNSQIMIDPSNPTGKTVVSSSLWPQVALKSSVVQSLTEVDSGLILDANQGPVITGLIDNRVPKNKINDSLTSIDSSEVLAASQGPVIVGLIDGKISTSKINNSLTSVDSSEVLAASQGPIINSHISGKISTSKISNSLTSIDSSEVLGAPQGRLLNEGKIDKSKMTDTIVNADVTTVLSGAAGNAINTELNKLIPKTSIVSSIDETDSTKVLSATSAALMKTYVNDTVITLTANDLKQSSIVNSLTSTDNTKVLSAAQGPAITSAINTAVTNALTTVLDFGDIQNDLLGTDPNKVLSAAQGPAITSAITSATNSCVKTTSIENSLTSTDATRVLSAAQGPEILGNLIRPYDVTKAYKTNNLVIRDSNIYTANGNITANTPFAIGTSGATWKIVSDETNITGDVINATTLLSTNSSVPTDMKPNSSAGFDPVLSTYMNKYLCTDYLRYVDIGSGSTSFSNLQLLFNNGGRWQIIDRPVSGRWIGGINYNVLGFGNLWQKNVSSGDLCTINYSSTLRNYKYDSGNPMNPSSWKYANNSDIEVAGVYPFVNPSLVDVIPDTSTNTKAYITWPAEVDDVSYSVYVSSSENTLGSPQINTNRTSASVTLFTGNNYFYIKRLKNKAGGIYNNPSTVARSAFPIEMTIAGKKLFTGPGTNTDIIITSCLLQGLENVGTRMPFSVSTNRTCTRVKLSLAPNTEYSLTDLFAQFDNNNLTATAVAWDATNNCGVYTTSSNPIGTLGYGMPCSIDGVNVSTNYTICKSVTSSTVRLGKGSPGMTTSGNPSISIPGRRAFEIIGNPEGQGAYYFPVESYSSGGNGVLTVTGSPELVNFLANMPLHLASIKFLPGSGFPNGFTNEYYPVINVDTSTRAVSMIVGNPTSPIAIPSVNNYVVQVCIASHSIANCNNNAINGQATGQNALVLYNTGLCLVNTLPTFGQTLNAITLNGYHFTSTKALYTISNLYLDNTLRSTGEAALLTKKYNIPNTEYVDMSDFGGGITGVRSKYGASVFWGYLDTYNGNARFSINYGTGMFNNNTMSTNGNTWQLYPTSVDDNLNVWTNPNFVTTVPMGGQWSAADNESATTIYNCGMANSYATGFSSGSASTITGYNSTYMTTKANNPWAQSTISLFGYYLKYTNFLTVPSGDGSTCINMWYDSAVNKLVWKSSGLNDTSNTWRTITLSTAGISNMGTKPGSDSITGMTVNSDDLNGLYICLGSNAWLIEFDWDTNTIVKKTAATVLNPFTWNSEEAANAGSGMVSFNGGRFITYRSDPSAFNGSAGTFTLKMQLTGKIGSSSINTAQCTYDITGTANNLSGPYYPLATARNMLQYGWAAANMIRNTGLSVVIQGHDDNPITLYNTVQDQDYYLAWISLNTSIALPASPASLNVSG